MYYTYKKNTDAMCIVRTQYNILSDGKIEDSARLVPYDGGARARENYTHVTNGLFPPFRVNLFAISLVVSI